MICLKCGEKNPSNKTSCSHCQNSLSHIPPHKSHISQLIREGEAVYNGEGEPETLEDMVENLFRLFDHLEAKQSRLKQKAPEECKKAFQKFQDATLMLFDGLDEIDIYFEDFDKSHIEEGLEMLKEAEILHTEAIEELEDIANS